jgi:hypothetical protein
MSMQAAKGSVAAVVAVVGWALVYLSVAHSWALLTARERVVGPTGFVASEVVRIAPTLVYFFAVGLVMALLFGAATGARWAALATAIAMALEALLEKQVFFGGIDALAVAVLAVNYLLPIAVATGGALIARLWQNPKGGTVAT